MQFQQLVVKKGPLGAITLLSKNHSQKKPYTYFIFGTHSVSNEKWQIIVSTNQNLLLRDNKILSEYHSTLRRSSIENLTCFCIVCHLLLYYLKEDWNVFTNFAGLEYVFMLNSSREFRWNVAEKKKAIVNNADMTCHLFSLKRKNCCFHSFGTFLTSYRQKLENAGAK